MALAIVLARGGSKGLPRKNALPVAGKPMVAWSLEHALNSQRIDQVVLSTDDDELTQIAESMGVAVIHRPPQLASDTAAVDAAARHCVQSLGTSADHLAILYGNIPVRPANLTDRALQTLRETGCDSVQSVYRVGKTHPYWMKTVANDTDGGELGMYVENNIYRRQDLPPVYMLDGGVIALTRQSLETVIEEEPHAFLGQDRRAIITQEGAVVDVDAIADLRVAEAILSPSRLVRGREREGGEWGEELETTTNIQTMNELTDRVIGAAIEVLKTLGCGFLERVYENALALALRKSGLEVEQQDPIDVRYENQIVGQYVCDLVINRQLLIELKAVKEISASHFAQTRHYLKATGLQSGLILNFGTPTLGIRRVDYAPK